MKLKSQSRIKSILRWPMIKGIEFFKNTNTFLVLGILISIALIGTVLTNTQKQLSLLEVNSNVLLISNLLALICYVLGSFITKYKLRYTLKAIGFFCTSSSLVILGMLAYYNIPAMEFVALASSVLAFMFATAGIYSLQYEEENDIRESTINT